MMNIEGMYHACTRRTVEEINDIMSRINEVVQTNGYMTKNALFAYALNGRSFTDEYNHVGWTIGACEHAVLTTSKDYYDLYLPQPDWFDNKCEKENDEMDKHYIGNFDSRIDARFTLDRAIGTAELYGHVTMADILDLIGDKCEYTDTKRGWTESCIKKGNVRRIGNTYVISLPKCNWFDDAAMIHPSEEKSTAKPKQSQPEPINITIPADKPELIREVIDALCGNSEKIKDRPVFINIV